MELGLFQPRILKDGIKQTGRDVPSMDRNGDCLTVLLNDVVAAMNPDNLPSILLEELKQILPRAAASAARTSRSNSRMRILREINELMRQQQFGDG